MSLFGVRTGLAKNVDVTIFMRPSSRSRPGRRCRRGVRRGDFPCCGSIPWYRRLSTKLPNRRGYQLSLCGKVSSALVRAKEKKGLFPCFFGMLELNLLLLIRVYLGFIVEGVICSIRWRYDGFQQEVNISCRNLVLKAGAFHIQRENPRVTSCSAYKWKCGAILSLQYDKPEGCPI